MSKWERDDIPMRKCPVCGKEFVYNKMSIYKITYKSGNSIKIKWCCSYTCWRKAGGDSDNSKRRLKEQEKIRKELLGQMRLR